MMALTGLSGSWTPFEHTVCGREALLSHEDRRYIPAFFLNSPYGGRAFGLSQIPWPIQPGVTIGVGGPTSNGTVITDFVGGVNVSLYQLQNFTNLGLGINEPCRAYYGVELQLPHLNRSIETWIPTASNLTDAGEVDNFSILSTPDNQSTVAFFNNSFSVWNADSVSTCGGVAQTIPVKSSSLTIGIPFTVGGRTLTIPYILPFAQNFTYRFPANFGSWEVGNLSEPGGPGGGWAFNFLGGCP
ncbi:MAG: hypothetical protein ACLQC7_05470 [Thermoplasmata archaeon]